ncbi:MAG: hypothetical protein IK076_05915, partial [Bacteroidales bacterium]|nr:hypothetical protein [Bacteroidales bacterium]
VEEGGMVLYTEEGEEDKETTAYGSGEVFLRLTFDSQSNVFGFSYSTDGREFKSFGSDFQMHFGFWKGVRPGLFSYNTEGAGGTALFDDFVFAMDE